MARIHTGGVAAHQPSIVRSIAIWHCFGGIVNVFAKAPGQDARITLWIL
jgi:hypothetical protein